MSEYDDSLDPISPNFDRRSWGDTPMLDEEARLLLTHPDPIRAQVIFHSEDAGGRPVSQAVVKRILARNPQRRPQSLTMRMLHVRLRRTYAALSFDDFGA